MPPNPRTGKAGLVERVRARIYARVRAERARRPGFDHVVRAYGRNSEVLGGQLAAAITYFGFLSFFPLLALGFAVVGYATDGDPGAQRAVTDAVEGAFPSLIGSGEGRINIQDVIDAKAGAGLIGLLGLFYSGLGWLDALRDALRRVFGTSDLPIGLVKKKVVDVVVLVGLGLALVASIVVTGLATAVTQQVLDHVGLGDSLVALALLKVLSVSLALVADTVLFAILLSRLSGARLPWRQVRSGALLGAVGFEALKLLATFLIARTTSNPVYATFGVIVGLLVWINLVSKLLMFAAAWTATQSLGTEPAPVVPPGDLEEVPVGAPAYDADTGTGVRRRAGWRRAALGAALGAGAAAVLTRRRGGSAEG